MSTFSKLMKSAATLSILGLALTACGGADDGDTDTNGDTGTNGTEETTGTDSGAAADADPISLAVFNGWEEGIAVSELWKNILEDKGYTVNLEYAEPAVVYSGLSTGDYDFTMDAWLPVTHARYLEEFGDDMEEIGVWNDEALLTIAVNEDAPISSLEELADHADDFGSRIVGIDPGAGLTEATEDNVIPTYGLDDWEFVTSSTPAMLQELSTAIDNGENIVVTLWRPHWAYDAFPIRDLEDPEGTLGGAETMSTYSRTGFTDDYAEVAGWLADFKMDSDTLYSLENLMFNENEGASDYAPIVEEWIADNQDYVDSLTN